MDQKEGVLRDGVDGVDIDKARMRQKEGVGDESERAFPCDRLGLRLSWDNFSLKLRRSDAHQTA